MPSEPVPLLFQLYFYSAIILAVLVSLIAIVLYRRAVLRNMLTRDASSSALPVIGVDGAATRVLPVGPASDYAVAEHRLKIRLALIYGAAILGVVLIAVWIRFFSGNTTLIRGSIIFTIWRLSLGSPVAVSLSAALVAAIGIPILAVLLAWSWRRAAAVFVVYVGVWAAFVFAIMIVLFGWSMANWAGTLVLFQVSLIAIIAPQPFLLLLLTGNRRVRAVAPMTLAGSLTFCAVLVAAFFLMPEVYRLQLLPAQVQKPLGRLGTLFISGGIVALFILLSLFVCRCLLRLLASLYERKVFSDRQLLVDCWSLVVILYVFARLGETPGTPQLLIAVAFILFFVYRLFIHIALRVFVADIERPPNRRLLLLRTFGFQRRTEGLFDAIGQRWRFHGAVLMIAGTDLASRTINPSDYLRFLGRRLRSRFISTDTDLQRNLERLDDRPDPDGRYRTNELFCCDHAWHKALVQLLNRADVVVMDLRGFGRNNAGCVFELQQLVERGPVGQVFLTVDDTTDRSLLDLTIQDAWTHMPDEARRDGAADLIVLPMAKQSTRAMEAVFVALQGAKPASVWMTARLLGISTRYAAQLEDANVRKLSDLANNRDLPELCARSRVPLHLLGQWQASAQVKLAARRQKLIALIAAVTAVLLISRQGILGRHHLPSEYRHLTSMPTFTDAYDSFRAIRAEANKALDADAHFKLGVDLDHEGHYDTAIAEYRKALALEPDREEAHYNLGVNLDHLGDYEDAIAEYRKALALKPDRAETHYNLGADLDHQGDYEAAVAEYRKAPNLSDSHYNLGVDLDRKGDFEAAIGEYRKASALNANDPDAHYNLGVDLIRQGDHKAAIPEFRKALVLKPGWAEAQIYLGGIMLQKGDAEAAIAEFRKAVSMKPDLAAAHYNLAVALHTTGRRQEAEREFQQALRLRPALKRPWN